MHACSPRDRTPAGLAILAIAGGCALVAPACRSASAALVPPVSLAPRLTIEKGGSHFTSMVYSPDGNSLLVGQRPQPRLWDVRSGSERVVLEGFDPADVSRDVDAARPVAFSPDGRTVAAARRGEVLLFDAETGKKRGRLEVPRADQQTLAFSQDGSNLLWAGQSTGTPFFPWDEKASGEVQAWSLATNDLAWSAHLDGMYRPCLSSDGTVLAYMDPPGIFADAEVRIWDTASRRERAVMKVPSHGSVARIDFTPDGKRISFMSYRRSGWHHDHLILGETVRGTVLVEVQGYPGSQSRFASQALALSPDGRFLASTAGGKYDRENIVRLWDAQTGQSICAAQNARDRYADGDSSALAFSPDGQSLAAAMTDGQIRIWEVSQLLGLVPPSAPQPH